jgi:hypothetical protein
MGPVRNSIGRSGGKVPKSGDRRGSCRYRVQFHDALLRWPGGPDFVQIPARLLDLSLTGCLLELPRIPQRTERQPIWFRSAADPNETWVEGVVLSIRKSFMKPCRMRIVFNDSFPYELFKKLVYGAEDRYAPVPIDTPPHEQDHYWK